MKSKMESIKNKIAKIDFIGKPGLYIMWGSYLAVISFGLALYTLGWGVGLVDPIHAGQIERSFFSMGIYNSKSFYISTGMREVSGSIGVFTILAYGLHFIAGISFERRKWFVIGWLAVVFIMTLRNLLSAYGI